MRRRGVLGFLGGAVVSGPAMAKQAVAQAAAGLEGLSLTGIATTATSGIEYVGGGIPIDSDWNELKWLNEKLAEFLGMSADDKAARREYTHVNALDPDLATNRSFSLSAKILIQQERNFARSLRQEEKQIRRDIARAILRVN